jgi:hypothetical protein
MDWIKKNYDRFALLLLAVALLASSAYLVLCVKGFGTRYEPVLSPVTHGKKVALLETEPLERAEQALAKPAEWGVHQGLLFVSRKYVVGKNATTKENVLIDPFEPGSTPLHPPVPNEWFLKNGLETAILESDALTQDPDKDGFSNLDEYLGKTDPLNPQSHPSYLTKLRLKKFVKVPFRLKFEAYDEGSFQINTVDVRQPTQFVKLGELIAGTKYKAIKFEKKSVLNPNTGVDRDVSELTVEHTESGLQVVLVVGIEANSPDQYARFAFLWDGTEFTVKKLQTFSLKPEPGVVYKLIDIKDNEALINNVKTDGDPIKVPHTEEPSR